MNKRTIFLKVTNIIFLIFFFACLIISLIVAQQDPAPRYQVLSQFKRFDANNAFWTTWSNWLTFIFLMLAFLNGKWGIWVPGSKSWITVCAYMSITAILFWMGIAGLWAEKDPLKNPAVRFANNYDSLQKWLITIFLHIVSSMSVVIGLIIRKNNKYVKKITWSKLNLFISFIFPIVYLIYISVRSYIIVSLKENYLDWESIKNYTKEDIGVFGVPYFFLDWTTKNGIEMFVFGISSLMVILILFIFLFTKINNKIVKNKNDISSFFELNFGSKKRYKNKNIEEFTFESIKIVVFLVVFALSLTRLLDESNYSDNNNLFLYNIIYFIYYAMNIIISIIGTVFSIVYVSSLKVKTNGSFWVNLIFSFISGVFIFSFIIGFLISILETMFYNQKK